MPNLGRIGASSCSSYYQELALVTHAQKNLKKSPIFEWQQWPSMEFPGYIQLSRCYAKSVHQ